MAKPLDPSDAVYRPVVFASDYKAIGREVNKTPTPELFPGYVPEKDEIAGERAYVQQRRQMEDAARSELGGHNCQGWWENQPGAQGPQSHAIELEREQQVRALQGGLSDAPADGGPQATENGNRIPVRWT